MAFSWTPAAAAALLAGALGWLAPARVSAAQAGPSEGAAEPPQGQPLVLERGAGLAPIRAPRNETLEFRVHVDVSLLEAAVGRVTLSSQVEPYLEPVLGAEAPAAGGETGAGTKEVAVFRCHGWGDYTLYSIDALIESRVLPQDWPRVQYLYTHSGTENRRRELLLGRVEGEPVLRYRSDTSKGAPKGRRIWRKPRERSVPEGAIDMLSAVYFARTLVERDLSSLSFPLVDKERLWQMTLTRGGQKRLQTPAGTFDAVEVVLQPATFPGEQVDEEALEKFEGLFGMQGSIHLWFELHSGVPVLIQGDLPIGPLTLGIQVVLQSAQGTPASFRNLDALEPVSRQAATSEEDSGKGD